MSIRCGPSKMPSSTTPAASSSSATTAGSSTGWRGNLSSADGLRSAFRLVKPAMKLIAAKAWLIAIAVAGALQAAPPANERPATWAQPVEVKGAPNLFKVSDSLYRSAQPTAEGMRNLKERGIVTVVSLRSFHSDRDEIGSTGMAYEGDRGPGVRMRSRCVLRLAGHCQAGAVAAAEPGPPYETLSRRKS
jgi:hypothetical protein